jgi:hypothetical protein
MSRIKYFVFAVCITLAISHFFTSIWDHDTKLAAAWFSAFCGWLSTLLANLAKDS